MAITNAQQYKQILQKVREEKAFGGLMGIDGRKAYVGGSYSGSTEDNDQGSGKGYQGGSGAAGSAESGKDVGSDGGPSYDSGTVSGDDYRRSAREFEVGVEGGKADVTKFQETVKYPDTKNPFKKFANFSNSKNRKFFESVIRAGKIPGLNFGTVSDMSQEELEEAYDNYMSDRLSGATDAYGNPTPNFGNDGGDNNYIPPIIPSDSTDDTEEEVIPDRNLGGLAARFAGSKFNFDNLADGGRAGMMDGGMMEDTPEGGIMDLESGRQMYFLGKLVKKATRAVKKVAKSPLGKAALMYGLGSLGASALGKYQAGTGTGFFSKIKPFMSSLKTDFFTKKNPLLFSDGKFSVGKATSLGIGIPFALDALGIGKEEEDNSAYEKYMKDMRLDIPALRGRRNLAAAFDGSTYNYEAYADGGRTGYQEGSKEPVAKKTMPLLDMDGQEMDLREDGGFVPLGRMERADDVPARLSKNEFVFTADAVRNAGEGDIDKGAEVMYNMMKNLESGGEVSEESQGLDGAREMFKTSQRLEEVL